MDPRLKEILLRKSQIRSLLGAANDADLAAFETELTALENEEKSIQQRASIAQRLGTGELSGTAVFEQRGQDKAPEAQTRETILGSEEYRSAWLKNLKGNSLSETEQRSISSAADSGGAVIPTVTFNKVIARLKQISVIFPLVSELNIPSNVKIPFEKTTADVKVVAMGTASTPDSDKVDYLSLTAYKLIKTIEIEADVDAMSISAFEEFIVTQLGNKMKMLVDYLIIAGTGSDEPTGILTSVTPIETAGTAWDYDDIQDLLGTLPSAYAVNARLIMSRQTLYKKIAKIKDEVKQPVFVRAKTDAEAIDRGIEGKLEGYPVTLYDNMPADTIIFGDLSFYFWNWVKAFAIAKSLEAGFLKGSVVYRALGLGDGDVALEEAFVVQQLKETSS